MFVEFGLAVGIYSLNWSPIDCNMLGQSGFADFGPRFT